MDSRNYLNKIDTHIDLVKRYNRNMALDHIKSEVEMEKLKIHTKLQTHKK